MNESLHPPSDALIDHPATGVSVNGAGGSHVSQSKAIRQANLAKRDSPGEKLSCSANLWIGLTTTLVCARPSEKPPRVKTRVSPTIVGIFLNCAFMDAPNYANTDE
ncbi:MAG TPA: hypothetical protein VF977_04305 [Candidatus Binatia bacterium]